MRKHLAFWKGAALRIGVDLEEFSYRDVMLGRKFVGLGKGQYDGEFQIYIVYKNQASFHL